MTAHRTTANHLTLSAAALALGGALLAAPAARDQAASSPPAIEQFTGARVFDGRGGFLDDAVVVVRGGRITTVGRPSGPPAAGIRSIALNGKYLVPGLVVAHAHISDVDGLKPRAYTAENVQRQLGVFARYGITSVLSLGGEQAPAFAARDAQGAGTLDRARVFVAGDVIAGSTPDEAKAHLARVAALKPDIIKIRVDDNLGTTAKMRPEVYTAVIQDAHARGLRVAAHIFYLEDAKALLRAGVDMIAHSVRDAEIDADFLALMKARNVPYCPTLTREVSTFVYESTPAFFADPFFLREADPAMVAALQQPARQQQMKTSATARRYQAALEVARTNLKKAADAGLLIVMGTDSGAFPERFEGYFEHLEMAMMVEAGLTPAQVLRSATVDAARAVGTTSIGALTPGAWADIVVLDKNPLEDIRNTRAISAVYVAGRLIPR